ncbi:MAG: transposase [Myxococcaceae bacterium]
MKGALGERCQALFTRARISRSEKTSGPAIALASDFSTEGEGVMGRPLRMYGSDGYYFVTARCFQSRLLLRPSPQVNEVLGGVLARAAAQAKVEVCGFVAASSHVHLLCRARDGELSKFMRYFLCNVSKKVGRLVNWTGSFWERRFSAEPVLDKESLDGRLRYIIAHGVKEGLVRKVADWPGLSCVPQLLGESKRAFRFYEWAKRWKSGRLVEGGQRAWSPKWATTEVLEVHPLEHWQVQPPEKRRARVRRMIATIEADARAKHRWVLGRDKVLAAHPHTRPRKPDRRPRPRVHVSTLLAKRIYMTEYQSFVASFKDAVKWLRSGVLRKAAEFPAYSFSPVVPVRV